LGRRGLLSINASAASSPNIFGSEKTTNNIKGFRKEMAKL